MDLTRRIRDKMMKERLMFVLHRGGTDCKIEIEIPFRLLMLLEKRDREILNLGSSAGKGSFMFVLLRVFRMSRGTAISISACRLCHYGCLLQNRKPAILSPTGNVLPSANINDLKSKLDEI